jgi:hypothetical protein
MAQRQLDKTILDLLNGTSPDPAWRVQNETDVRFVAFESKRPEAEGKRGSSSGSVYERPEKGGLNPEMPLNGQAVWIL